MNERRRVCIAGVTGWIGRALVPAVLADSRLALVGAVARSAAGQRLSDAVPAADCPVSIRATVAEALIDHETDVLIDFTSPTVVKQNVLAALERGVHVVVGTSGLDEADFVELDAVARHHSLGVLAVGNFAMSAVLLQHFAVVAARHMPSWELIDYASDGKPDAPSGTVRELAARLADVGRPALHVPVTATLGHIAARGMTAGGAQVHSVRLPGHVIGAEALFGAPSERLSLRYDGGPGPEPYVSGVLLSAARVHEHVGVQRGLDTLLGLT